MDKYEGKTVEEIALRYAHVCLRLENLATSIAGMKFLIDRMEVDHEQDQD